MIPVLIWLAFATLSAADAELTVRLLRQGGKHEANPILAWLFGRFGPAWALGLTKLLIVAALGAALWLRLPAAAPVGALLDLAMAWAVIQNARQVRR